LIRAGRDSDALAVLDRAVALNGTFAQAHNNRGIALARLGRAALAIAAFERALQLDPGNAEAALILATSPTTQVTRIARPLPSTACSPRSRRTPMR